MVTDKAIQELFEIIEMEGISRSDGQNVRKLALETWIEENVVEIEIENHVIKSNLNSEEEDFIKYYLALQIADRMMEDCARVNSEDNKIKVKVRALSQKFPKNEK